MSHVMQHIYVGISILFPLIMADLSLNYSIFGIGLAISSLIGGLFQIFFGVISRRVARHVLLGFGNVLLSFGTFLMGLAGNFVHFIGAKLVADTGTAPQHPMATAIITEKFDRGSATGKALGVHYGLGYVGNIIGPFFMTLLAVSIGYIFFERGHSRIDEDKNRSSHNSNSSITCGRRRNGNFDNLHTTFPS
jgi:MFS family permease